MTKSDLKYYVTETGSYFFSRDGMKFFGDTMANYGVRAKPVEIRTSLGEYHICWELYRKKPALKGLSDSAYFDVETYKRIIPAR